ncbi:MAG: hypothetical protein RQ856_06835 [Candidatus Izemoplasmatales bacterium]|nr:hypothetical protein [Candidatus Izemoplasmatales bacterium]
MKTFKSFHLKTLALLVVLVCFSCSDEDISSEALSNKNSQSYSIGNLHNQYLELAFNEFNYDTGNHIIELKKRFNNINIDGLNKDFQAEIIDSVAQLLESGLINVEIISNSYNESFSGQFFTEILDLLAQTDNQQSLSNELNQVKLQIESEILDESDRQSLLSFIEVLDSSSKFWFPTIYGGNGIGEDILGNGFNYVDVSYQTSPCTKAVVAADGMAAAAAFQAMGIGGWIAGALNPVAAGASVAVAVAFASGYAAATHPDCKTENENND